MHSFKLHVLDSYRLTVLRALPNLQKLDNIVVYPEEVQDALRKGRELVHPKDVQDVSPVGMIEWESGNSSLSHSPTQHEVCLAKNPISARQRWHCVSQDMNIPSDAVSGLRESCILRRVYGDGAQSKDTQWWPGDISVVFQMLHAA